MKLSRFLIVLSLLVSLMPLVVLGQGRLFKSSYLSFEIPSTWECQAFEQNWICHDKYQGKKVEALISVTAKIAGEWDTRENYLDYLKQPKEWVTGTGENIISEIKGAEAKFIYPNKYPWVEATHLNSEIQSYLTRYVGTICCDDSSSELGMLVVLSAHQEHWSKYADIFLRAANSLKVLDIEEAISKVRAANAAKAAREQRAYMDSLLQDDPTQNSKKEESSFLDDPMNLLLLAIALGACLALFVIKKKKSRKRKRRLKRSHKKRK